MFMIKLSKSLDIIIRSFNSPYNFYEVDKSKLRFTKNLQFAVTTKFNWELYGERFCLGGKTEPPFPYKQRMGVFCFSIGSFLIANSLNHSL